MTAFNVGLVAACIFDCASAYDAMENGEGKKKKKITDD